MGEMIDNNPTTRKPMLKEKYSIIVDDYFWENNPLQSKRYNELAKSLEDAMKQAFGTKPKPKKIRHYQGINIQAHTTIVKPR